MNNNKQSNTISNNLDIKSNISNLNKMNYQNDHKYLQRQQFQIQFEIKITIVAGSNCTITNITLESKQ